MRNFYLLTAALLLLLSGCKEETIVEPTKYEFDFQFITEEFKPFNYTERGELKGLGADLLRGICTNLSIPFNVTVLPWEEGYQKTLRDKNAVLFSTVLNSERKDLFKWAGPYASIDWQFYSSASSSIKLNSLEDAKTAGKIGVIKDYAIEQYLKEQGFNNFVYVFNNTEAFDKLLKGDIDLFPSDRITAEAALEGMGKNIWAVKPLMTILTDLVYFAFNKSVPDNAVEDFQREINRLRDNGQLAGMYQQYMGQLNPPAELQVYTEQYPPLTFRNGSGEITGFGTDIVREIMKRNGRLYPINLTLWSIGYQMAQNNPNFCLFTMDRTEIRDTLFRWVGPIGTNRTYFYVKAGSGITINSLEQAKALGAVGTVSSWFSDQYLRQQGFTNLVSGPDPAGMVTRLMNGEVDAFVCSAVTFPDIAAAAGYGMDQFTAAFELMSSDYYIAFSKSTPVSLVNLWQAALDKMKQDGSYDAIYNLWF